MLLDRDGIFGWYKFGDLPELFVEGADIGALDRFADEIESVCPSSLLENLPDAGPHQPLAEFVRRTEAALPGNCPRPTLKRFKLFVLAAAAARAARSEFSFRDRGFKWLVDLLTCDIEVMPFEGELTEAIVEKAAGSDMRVLVEEMSLARQYRGASRLVKVMGRLLDSAFINPLIDGMAEDADEMGGYEAAKVLAMYGDDAVAELGRRWADLDFVQRIHATETLSIVSSPAVVNLLVEVYPDMRTRSHDFELWCSMAEATADPELLKLLKNPPRGSNREARRSASVIQAVGGRRGA